MQNNKSSQKDKDHSSTSLDILKQLQANWDTVLYRLDTSNGISDLIWPIRDEINELKELEQKNLTKEAPVQEQQEENARSPKQNFAQSVLYSR